MSTDTRRLFTFSGLITNVQKQCSYKDGYSLVTIVEGDHDQVGVLIEHGTMSSQDLDVNDVILVKDVVCIDKMNLIFETIIEDPVQDLGCSPYPKCPDCILNIRVVKWLVSSFCIQV